MLTTTSWTLGSAKASVLRHVTITTYAVEACVSCDLCRMPKLPHCLLDVPKIHFLRDCAHRPAAL